MYEIGPLCCGAKVSAAPLVGSLDAPVTDGLGVGVLPCVGLQAPAGCWWLHC